MHVTPPHAGDSTWWLLIDHIFLTTPSSLANLYIHFNTSSCASGLIQRLALLCLLFLVKKKFSLLFHFVASSLCYSV